MHALYPVLGSHVTKPNTTFVEDAAREKAILTEAAAIFNKTNMDSQAVEDFLASMGINQKYVVDYNLSTKDGLVVLNTDTNKAILAFRGTSPQSLADWGENFEYVRNDYTVGDSFLLVKDSSKDLIIIEVEEGIPGPGIVLNLLVITTASIFKRKERI